MSLLDFFMLQGRPIIGLDQLGVVVFLLGVALEASALMALANSTP